MTTRIPLLALSLALVGCGLLDSDNGDNGDKEFEISIPEAEYSGRSISILLDSIAPVRGFDVNGARCEVVAEGTISATAGTGSTAVTITQPVVVDTAYILTGYWRMDTAFTSPNTVQRLFLGPSNYAHALDSAVTRVSSRCEAYLGRDSIVIIDPPPFRLAPVCESEVTRALYLAEVRNNSADQLRIEVSTKTLSSGRLRVNAAFKVRCTN